MKKALFTLFLAGFFAAAAFAQEQAISSQYQVLPILINPGYTGFNDQHEFLVNARSSWTGFPGKPTTINAMYHGPIGDKLALGGGLFSDKAGDINTLRFQLNYAFRFRLNKTRIGIGLSTEFLNRSVDKELLNNPLVEKNDIILENAAQTQRHFNSSFGVHALYDDRFFLSFSLPSAISTRLDDVPVAASSEEGNGGFLKYYILQLGYIVNIQEQNFKLMPSMTIRHVRDVPYQIDFNLQGRFLDEKLIAGLTYRQDSNGFMGFLIGTKYQKFQFFYSYDVSFSNFQKYTNGSHELSLAYALDRKVKAKPQPVNGN